MVIDIDKSPTLFEYKKKMRQILSMYYPTLSLSFIDEAIDEHIENKFKDAQAEIRNSYTDKQNLRPIKKSLLEISDYIDSEKPLCTALGTLFEPHEKVRNLMFETMQSFLDLRKIHKKEMFKYPKGSAEFSKYNLLQLLTI